MHTENINSNGWREVKPRFAKVLISAGKVSIITFVIAFAAYAGCGIVELSIENALYVLAFCAFFSLYVLSISLFQRIQIRDASVIYRFLTFKVEIPNSDIQSIAPFTYRKCFDYISIIYLDKNGVTRTINAVFFDCFFVLVEKTI